MPKRTKEERQARRQQIIGNIRTFIDKHDDKVLPVIRTVIERRFPVASTIVDAIQEARASKLPADTKDFTIQHLQELLDLTDEDPQQQPADMVNSTLVTKFISPINLILSSITFYGGMITEILAYWGVIPKQVDPMLLATIAGVYGSMHGLHIWQRGELKKKAIESL